ncbi:DUF5996 family protein [Streptomyces sp. NPDC048197]|uniref:DUF5996 family protein n=1 Tax=Streptomyces sp. NPDC048197 TaxID=3365511 RepID=UPI00371E057A
MELFPPMPLREWRDTKETLHRFAQIVGKIRFWRTALESRLSRLDRPRATLSPRSTGVLINF